MLPLLRLQIIVFNSQITDMQALLSPQCSNSFKPELFTKCRSPSLRNQRSPSCRNQRIPSLQEHLCHSNHILRSSKQDSPSKASEEIKRKKSQLAENNQLSSSNTKKKQKSIATANPNTQNIMSSIQDLKQEYQILKQAYKDLIQQKIKSQEQIMKAKLQNNILKMKIQEHTQKQQVFQSEIAQLKGKLRLTQLQLEKERKNNKDLENDLYFFREKEKSNTDHLVISSNNIFQLQPFASDRFKQAEKEAFLDSEKIADEMESNIINDSHLLSFSLTSVIDQSIRLQQFSCRRKEHVKVVSDLSQVTNQQFRNIEVKNKKNSFNTFKKNKKESKLDLINESKAIAPSPISQLLNLKSPASNDKKNLKAIANSSTTKRRKEDKENTDFVKNLKKKSKKVLQLGGIDE